MNYRRLFRSRNFGRQEIHEAEDHLLVVTGTYTNRFRRLYYSDITAMLMTKSDRRRVASGIIGFVAIISFLIVLGASNQVTSETGYIILVMLAFWLLVWAFVFYSLPRKRIYLQTKLQRVDLIAVKWQKEENKLREFLSEKVAAYQGEVDQAVLWEAAKTRSQKDTRTPPPLPPAMPSFTP